MNQVRNEERETLVAEMMDELLFVTGKDTRYFLFDAFLLVLDRIVFFEFRSSLTVWKCVGKVIIDDFKPALLRTDERPWVIYCRRINYCTFNHFQ